MCKGGSTGILEEQEEEAKGKECGRTLQLNLQCSSAYFGRIPARKALFLVCLHSYVPLPIHSALTETIPLPLFKLWKQ